MQLKHITSENWQDAVALLCEGFPDRDAAFWHRGLQRWEDVTGDPFTGPVGFLTHDKQGRPSSVLLTFRAPTGWNAAQQVNFSSWYVKENHRPFAPMMLKRCSDDSAKTYTDFTASHSVQHMLRRLDYTEYQRRHLGFWTPLLALRPGAPILNADAILRACAGKHALVKALQDHQRLGCIIVGISTPEGPAPVVLRIKKRKHIIKCAEIIYCNNVKYLTDNLVGIARHLALRGVLILEGEFGTIEGIPKYANDWGHTVRFVKGAWQADQIDYLYSEVPILGV